MSETRPATTAAEPPIVYRVEHRTEYRYGAKVSTGHSIVRLLPRHDVPGQTVRAAVLRIEPEAEVVAEHLDAFGNRVHYLAVERPHDHLCVVGVSEVAVEPAAPTHPPCPPWDTIAELVSTSSDDDDGLLARQCRLDSTLVARSADLERYARPSFPRGRPLDEAIAHLSARIHRDFTFDPGFSDLTTPLVEVFEHRRGVCQDFAHLAIGCLRSLGLPARYVSGYLETEPPPGQERLVGADASHAWCAAYAPGVGWLDLDPTNDQVPPRRHVTVAWGRDYEDVAPLRGVVYGPMATQDLVVAVDVVRLPVEPASEATAANGH